MTREQQVFALVAGTVTLLTIVELIRRRRLREEYSWLWFATGTVVFVLVVWYDLLVAISDLIGAKLPTTTLFLCSLLFLMALNIHYSIKISALTNQVKDLAQALAIHAALTQPAADAGRAPEPGDGVGQADRSADVADRAAEPAGPS